MQNYRLKAVDRDGTKINRVFSFLDENEIVSYAETNGLQVLGVFKAGSSSPVKKVKKSAVVEVLESLQLVVKAGLPVNIGLTDIAKDVDVPELGDALELMSYRIQMGMSFSKAMGLSQDLFGDVVINLIKIGEETGQLDNTLLNAVKHIKKVEEIKSKAKSAMYYPIFAMVALFGAMTFWFAFVLPQMATTFKDLGIPLPAITRGLLAASSFVQANILYMLLTPIALIFTHIYLRKKLEEYRFKSDKVNLKIPIVGLIISNYNYAFFAEYVRLMIAAGLPLYQALQIMENSLSNLVFKRASGNIREAIAIGKSFSDAITSENMFPNIVLRMISIGEQTGHLDDQLENIAEYYYKKVDYLADNIAKMIGPLIIVILGLFMLVIFIALLMPIFDLIGGIGR